MAPKGVASSQGRPTMREATASRTRLNEWWARAAISGLVVTRVTSACETTQAAMPFHHQRRIAVRA
jgi:hypothetical protein